MSGRAIALAVVVVASAPVAPARAERGPLVEDLGAARIDWTAGLITVKAVGTADRRAPSPAVARVGPLREAEVRAAAALVTAARALAVPGGGTVADGLDAAALGRLEALAAAAVDVDTPWLPDGSVRVTRGLPLEAVRQLAAGPRVIEVSWTGAAAADETPTAIVVDARAVAVTPRLGVQVGQGATAAALPTVWRRTRPGAKDAQLGARPLRVTATALDGATLVVDGVDVAAARASGALVIVVVSEDR